MSSPLESLLALHGASLLHKEAEGNVVEAKQIRDDSDTTDAEPTPSWIKKALQHGATTADVIDEFLAHYGQKGMRWGVRRNLQKIGPNSVDRAAYIAKKDAKWTAKVEANPKLAKVSRVAARDAKKQTTKLKEDYKARGLNIKKDGFAQTRYDTELKGILENSVDKASYKVHKMSPSRLSEMQIHRHPDGSLSAKIAPRTNAKISKQQGKIARTDTRAIKKAVKDASAGDKKLQNDIENKLSPYLNHSEEDLKVEDFNGLEFYLPVDEDGFVTDVVTPFDNEGEVEHDGLEVDDFLAHYGVKGMRWGVRRKSDESADSAVTKSDAKAAVKAPDTHVSADAERFIKARQKEGVSMSDREIKETLARARMVDDYNKMFSPDVNADLSAQVQALKLQKEYSQLNAELNPSAITRVKSLVAGAEGAYGAFKRLDDSTGGAISKQFKGAFAAKPPAKTTTTTTKGRTGPLKINMDKVKVGPTKFGPGSGLGRTS